MAKAHQCVLLLSRRMVGLEPQIKTHRCGVIAHEGEGEDTSSAASDEELCSELSVVISDASDELGSVGVVGMGPARMSIVLLIKGQEISSVASGLRGVGSSIQVVF